MMPVLRRPVLEIFVNITIYYNGTNVSSLNICIYVGRAVRFVFNHPMDLRRVRTTDEVAEQQDWEFYSFAVPSAVKKTALIRRHRRTNRVKKNGKKRRFFIHKERVQHVHKITVKKGRDSQNSGSVIS